MNEGEKSPIQESGPIHLVLSRYISDLKKKQTKMRQIIQEKEGGMKRILAELVLKSKSPLMGHISSSLKGY